MTTATVMPTDSVNEAESGAAVLLHLVVRRWIVAEYCGHNFYMGWHLYLRENPGYQKRNENGDWGWVRPGDISARRVVEFMATLGIHLRGDWTCPEYGCAVFVKRYPLKGRKIWGEKRGGVEVLEGYWGDLTLYTPNDLRERPATPDSREPKTL